MTICGTPLYSSPELLKKVGYSYKVDIWAIGIICYELLVGRTPFHARNLEDLVSKIDKGDYFVNGKDEEMTVECALFLSQCLQSDEMNRIDADYLVVHPFLSLDLKQTEIPKEAYTSGLAKKLGKQFDIKSCQ